MILTLRLKAAIVEYEDAADTRQRVNVPGAKDQFATTEKLLQAVFSIRSEPRQYKEQFNFGQMGNYGDLIRQVGRVSNLR
jgi:hypothetical protein